MERGNGARPEPTGDDRDGELTDLLEGCRAGAPDAWREVVGRLTPSVLTVARSLGLDSRDCEDVCQSTWMHAVRAVDVIEQPDRLRPWIITVARRESIKLKTATCQQVPVEHLGSDADHSVDDGPEDAVVARAEDRRVRAALRRLPRRQRALMWMLAAEPSLSYDDIAGRLDIPRGSIGPTRARILRRLRGFLEPDRAVGPGRPADELSRDRRPA